jgi:ATP-dependent protease HslVU (ClpYQ) peptidase subunit
MTTIAWKDGVLASDSRETNGSHLYSDKVQKIYMIDRVPYTGDTLLAVGIAGSSSHTDLYLNYLHSSKFPQDHFEHHACGVIVGEKYVYMFEQNEGYLIRYNWNTHMSVGSGDVYALSAMALGKSATEAVAHAKKFDMATGGKIVSLNFKRK